MSTEFHPLTISKVERLTKDAVALTFDLPAELREEYRYHQGQHLTLKHTIDGQDVRRSYSICNGVQQQCLSVAIKTIEQGVFSNFANQHLQAGMTLEVMPPQGHFYCELNKTNRKHYLMIAAGSGITPILSHLQSVLHTEPHSQVTLIFGNRSTPQMMFREKLSFIKNQFIDRLQWINCFTAEESDAELFNGRISGEKLAAMDEAKLIRLADYNEVMLCGPELMITDVVEFLKKRGMSPDNIHYELFFVGSADQAAKASQAERAQKYGSKVSRVSVKVAGRKTQMDLAFDGTNILDAAMEQGADLPFSCKGGVCATCKAKVVKGEVEMDMNHSLTPEEVAAGMILTCQSHPVSDEVEVDFDLAIQ